MNKEEIINKAREILLETYNCDKIKEPKYINNNSKYFHSFDINTNIVYSNVIKKLIDAGIKFYTSILDKNELDICVRTDCYYKNGFIRYNNEKKWDD